MPEQNEPSAGLLTMLGYICFIVAIGALVAMSLGGRPFYTSPAVWIAGLSGLVAGIGFLGFSAIIRLLVQIRDRMPPD